MQKIFTTDGIPAPDRYLRWREFCSNRFAPMAYTNLGERPFDASVAGADVDGLTFTQTALSPVKVVATPQTVRHPDNRDDLLWIGFRLSGSMMSEQDGRSIVEKPGDFAVYDPSRTLTLNYPEPIEQLMIQLPRERLEGMLGPARNFTGLAVHGHLPTTALVRSFLGDLLDVHERLTPEAAVRMMSVGVDLIVAGIAERMALETPKPLHGTLTVQRANAYIEANLGNVDLDPAQVAAATGVSLRHLQALFRERGRQVAEWIWHRRLQVAAQRLSDPGFMHLPLGELAYGCGFVNQAHFSRRFKDRFDLSPGDYRRQALTAAAAPAGTLQTV